MKHEKRRKQEMNTKNLTMEVEERKEMGKLKRESR